MSSFVDKLKAWGKEPRNQVTVVFAAALALAAASLVVAVVIGYNAYSGRNTPAQQAAAPMGQDYVGNYNKGLRLLREKADKLKAQADETRAITNQHTQELQTLDERVKAIGKAQQVDPKALKELQDQLDAIKRSIQEQPTKLLQDKISALEKAVTDVRKKLDVKVAANPPPPTPAPEPKTAAAPAAAPAPASESKTAVVPVVLTPSVPANLPAPSDKIDYTRYNIIAKDCEGLAQLNPADKEKDAKTLMSDSEAMFIKRRHYCSDKQQEKLHQDAELKLPRPNPTPRDIAEAKKEQLHAASHMPKCDIGIFSREKGKCV